MRILSSRRHFPYIGAHGLPTKDETVNTTCKTTISFFKCSVLNLCSPYKLYRLFKGTFKEKLKEVFIDWSLNTSQGVDRNSYEFYLMFLSQKIGISKLNYIKCGEVSSFIQIIFSKYPSNLNITIFQRYNWL